MAFFENIGKKITDAGQGVALQTKKLTDTTRLNAKIAENKEKMSQRIEWPTIRSNGTTKC